MPVYFIVIRPKNTEFSRPGRIPFPAAYWIEPVGLRKWVLIIFLNDNIHGVSQPGEAVLARPSIECLFATNARELAQGHAELFSRLFRRLQNRGIGIVGSVLFQLCLKSPEPRRSHAGFTQPADFDG